MNEGLALLRTPFPANQISYLPKGGIKLAYVGHAALTDRLLDADPMWAWEPLAMSDNGLPVMDDMGGMWIRLTVCGVTRLGYGHAGTKTGGDAIKEVIGDALRNAAMRFGAALDLWHKGDLHAHEEETSLERDLKASIDAAKEKRHDELADLALEMIEQFEAGCHGAVCDLWFAKDAFRNNDEKVMVWKEMLGNQSALRALLQANDPNRDHKPAPEGTMVSAGPGLKKTFVPTTPRKAEKADA